MLSNNQNYLSSSCDESKKTPLWSSRSLEDAKFKYETSTKVPKELC